MAELNEVQAIIRKHPQSPFNKSFVMTRLTEDGSITLTETSFTQWAEGKMSKKEIDRTKFLELKALY